MTEAELMSQVIALAKLRGWSCYHTHLSIRSEPGFPDLVLVRNRVMFRELKSARGKVSHAQQRWLDMLKAAGADADVWFPADLLNGRVMRELAPVWQTA